MDPSYYSTGAPPWPPAATYPSYYGAPFPSAGVPVTAPSAGVPVTAPSAGVPVTAPSVGVPVTAPQATFYVLHTPQPIGPWSTGLFDCCDDPSNSLITFCFPCITFGQVAEIIDKGSTSCGASAALYALIMYLKGCNFLYSCFYRSKLRAQYGLSGDPSVDFLVHLFCEFCSLCQMYRELHRRGFDMNIGFRSIWLSSMDLCMLAREHGKAGANNGDDICHRRPKP